MESPTNPRMQVIDIKGIADAARAAGAYSLLDNSIMAPIFQQPLALGVGDCSEELIHLLTHVLRLLTCPLSYFTFLLQISR